jgi:hypothetical protein
MNKPLLSMDFFGSHYNAASFLLFAHYAQQATAHYTYYSFYIAQAMQTVMTDKMLEQTCYCLSTTILPHLYSKRWQ